MKVDTLNAVNQACLRPVKGHPPPQSTWRSKRSLNDMTQLQPKPIRNFTYGCFTLFHHLRSSRQYRQVQLMRWIGFHMIICQTILKMHQHIHQRIQTTLQPKSCGWGVCFGTTAVVWRRPICCTKSWQKRINVWAALVPVPASLLQCIWQLWSWRMLKDEVDVLLSFILLSLLLSSLMATHEWLTAVFLWWDKRFDCQRQRFGITKLFIFVLWLSTKWSQTISIVPQKCSMTANLPKCLHMPHFMKHG